jgi:integrase
MSQNDNGKVYKICLSFNINRNMAQADTNKTDEKSLTLNTDLKKIVLKDGRNYSVRLDRHRYFFPDEWIKFVKSLRQSEEFEFQFYTGCRHEEGSFTRPMDYDFDRNNVRLWKTKTKAKKGETHGQPRTISLPSGFSKKMKKFCSKFKNDEYIFVNSKGKQKSVQGANQLLKRKLKEIGIKDYYNFSTHNIRKTHGMYLKALGIEMSEICQRLGHDSNTYIKHYGSADIFSERDMAMIRELMDDLYIRQRRF